MSLKINKWLVMFMLITNHNTKQCNTCKIIKTMPKGRTLDDAFNGKMHIDHIVPKSIFDLSNEDQIKQAWCLTNLRLVDAKDNLSKGDKCIYLL